MASSVVNEVWVSSFLRCPIGSIGTAFFYARWQPLAAQTDHDGFDQVPVPDVRPKDGTCDLDRDAEWSQLCCIDRFD